MCKSMHTQAVGPAQALLRAERISRRRTQVVHFDHDTLSPGYWIPLVVARNAQFPTCATCRASALPAGDAEEVFRGGGVEAWVAEPATGGGVGVTITGTGTVAGAIGGEAGFVGLSEGDGGQGREINENCLIAHGCGGGREERGLYRAFFIVDERDKLGLKHSNKKTPPGYRIANDKCFQRVWIMWSRTAEP